jgi:hypothetical protein
LLEAKIAEAIEKALASPDTRHLNFHPDSRTLHLMAKAATTVYEAVTEATKR